MAADLAALGYTPTVLISSPSYAGWTEGDLAVPFLVQKGYHREYFAITRPQRAKYYCGSQHASRRADATTREASLAYSERSSR